MKRSHAGSRVRAAVLAGVLLAWPAAGWSADYMGGTHEGATHATTNKAATNFVKEAAEGGMAEVKLGQLAEQKATSPDVKAFGQRMATDHGKVNGELQQLAAEKNVTLPKGLDSKDQALYDRLSKLSGHQFDKTYMSEMVKDHKADIAEFQKAAHSPDPQVKDFASKTLPTLEDHLREAQQIASATTSHKGK